MVTGAATAGSDLDGTAKRAQRAKKKKPSGNPETGITMSRNITIDMLRQADKSNQDLTIEQILLESCPDKDTFSKERFDYEMEYDRLFTGFGFEKSDKTRLFRSFSGGEQTKISLIKLLLEKSDLLLLDEPTNHLDMKTVEWLEDYLINYPKAVVMVSHDRHFLMRLQVQFMSLKMAVCTDMPATTRSTGSRSLKICRYSAKPTSASRRRLRTIMSLSRNLSISRKKLRLHARARPCWHAWS